MGGSGGMAGSGGMTTSSRATASKPGMAACVCESAATAWSGGVDPSPTDANDDPDADLLCVVDDDDSEEGAARSAASCFTTTRSPAVEACGAVLGGLAWGGKDAMPS